MIYGSSSAHFPFLALRWFFNDLMMVSLLDSDCSLAYGYRGVGINIVMFHSSQKRFVLLLINYDPLSHIISDGTPKPVYNVSMYKAITSLSRTY